MLYSLEILIKTDLIKAAFKRSFIGEIIKDHEVEDRLRIFMETNEKIMCHQDRFFITPTEQKKLRAPYLDSSLCMSDNEDVINDANIRFRRNHNSVPDLPPILGTREEDDMEIGTNAVDTNRCGDDYFRNMAQSVVMNSGATKEDHENLMEACTHIAAPGKARLVHDVICETANRTHAIEGAYSTLMVEFQKMASDYDGKAKKKP